MQQYSYTSECVIIYLPCLWIFKYYHIIFNPYHLAIFLIFNYFLKIVLLQYVKLLIFWEHLTYMESIFHRIGVVFQGNMFNRNNCICIYIYCIWYTLTILLTTLLLTTLLLTPLLLTTLLRWLMLFLSTLLFKSKYFI